MHFRDAREQVGVNKFGDKTVGGAHRPYSVGAGRTYADAKELEHADIVFERFSLFLHTTWNASI